MFNRFLFLSAFLLVIGGCEVGPDYVRPPVDTPAAYKEAGNWQLAQPQDTIDRGAWWTVYNDPQLNDLEQQVIVSNQNLKAAEAAYRVAVQAIEESRSTLFPTLSLGANGTRSGSFGNGNTSALTNTGGGTNTTNNGNSLNTTTGTIGSTGGSIGSTGSGGRGNGNYFQTSLTASWAPDVWGRIRRTIESDQAEAQASAADLANATLSAQATLATDYLDLRVQDELDRLLKGIIESDTKALQIVQNQYKQGVAAQADVLQAQTQLESVEAQGIDVGVNRATLEHAIAVLIGKAPAEFSLPPVKTVPAIPNVAGELPSALLQRRPDIAAAERAMAAANAQIGVEVSAYYPDITLEASTGVAATALGKLLQASSSYWSFGPSLAETLIDFGARDAAVAQARANYDEAVASYRQTTLTAFQQVEDDLSTLRILANEAKAEDITVIDARKSEQVVLNQYKEGIVPYSSVLTAQTTRLTAEQTALTVRKSQLDTGAAFVQALGGGWDTAQLPKP